MSELNREQIIKGLERFHDRILNSKLARDVYGAEMEAIISAISLIKKLTEENERLNKEVKYWEFEAKEARTDIDKSTAEAKAITVRNMQERVKSVFDGNGIFVRNTNDYIRFKVDEIAKEMLEDKQCT